MISDIHITGMNILSQKQVSDSSTQGYYIINNINNLLRTIVMRWVSYKHRA